MNHINDSPNTEKYNHTRTQHQTPTQQLHNDKQREITRTYKNIISMVTCRLNPSPKFNFTLLGFIDVQCRLFT